MRLIRFLTLALLALLSARGAWAIEVGQPAPDFPFLESWKMEPGKSRLSDFRGSVVLLEVWASW